MSFDHFFRGFFNIPRRNREEELDPFQEFFKETESETLNEDDSSNLFSENFGMFGHGSVFTEASEMFKHFEEMFRNIGLAEFPPPNFGYQVPQIDESSPRDKMLKVPDVEDGLNRRKDKFSIGSWFDSQKSSESKMDSDMDDKVAKEGLSQLLKDKNEEGCLDISPRNRSFSSFISIRTFTTADGKTEERRTTRDGRGNVDTEVRRTAGDQTHAVATRTRPDGGVEKREDLINLDPDSLEAFEKKWRLPGRGRAREGDPSYSSIFRHLFGAGRGGE